MNQFKMKNEKIRNGLRLVIFAILIFNYSLVFAQDRPASVLLDCREGIGLVPNMWRGMTLQTGDVPERMSLNTVCLGPGPVAHAWAMRRRGGSYDWGPLDQALTQLGQQKVDVVLVLPVSQFEDVHWVEIVTETVRHVGKRVSVFEFRAAPGADIDRYLEFYEAGAWAIHQMGANVRLGAPGLAWTDAGGEALIRRCSERNIPFHVLTWQVDVQGVDDIARSIVAGSELIGEYPLARLPSRLITGWRLGEQAIGVGLSAVMQAMSSDVEAICLADSTDLGWVAMNGLNPLSAVRLPVVIQAPDGGVSGVAHLDYETVLAVFWHARTDGNTPMTATFSGLPWGDHIRVEQLRLTPEDGEFKMVFAETREFHEPMSVNFTLMGEGVTAVRLIVE